jgi:Ca-activated chloride channel homolog
VRFQDTQFLLLLLLLIPWAWLRWNSERRSSVLPLSCETRMALLPETARSRSARYLPVLRLLALTTAILALARPQVIERETTVRSQGVDLVVALDLSTSMLAEELGTKRSHKNRLMMAKEVLADFLRARHGDRIGLIVFAGRPYQAAPLTLDHDWLLDAVTGLNPGVIEDGTALGDAIVAAVNRLRGQRGGSQAVILMTDGRNNAGATEPRLAAAAAKAMGIRVHAVGIGTRGPAVVPIDDPLKGTQYRQVDADLDEATLRDIATTTGGAYFRADDGSMLADVFREIDRLEKHPIEEKVSFTIREWFPVPLVGTVVLGMLELILATTALRRLP